jgi:hypothetical protein
MKPKIYRAIGSRLKPGIKPGMAVRMSDGWCGKVEQDAGGIVACIRDGELPDPHWVGDYRLVSPSSITILGNKAMVVWKSAVAASKPAGRGVVVDLARARHRARLEHEWQSRAIS